MEEKRFDLFESIVLNEEDKKCFDEQKEVSNIIVMFIKRRIDLKISQRELAKMTGIKQPVIARIECFEETPRLDTLVKIAKALDLQFFAKN